MKECTDTLLGKIAVISMFGKMLDKNPLKLPAQALIDAKKMGNPARAYLDKWKDLNGPDGTSELLVTTLLEDENNTELANKVCNKIKLHYKPKGDEFSLTCHGSSAWCSVAYNYVWGGIEHAWVIPYFGRCV